MQCKVMQLIPFALSNPTTPVLLPTMAFAPSVITQEHFLKPQTRKQQEFNASYISVPFSSTC